MLERNVVIKNPVGKLRVALVYPNLYPVGMANLGYQLIYDLLNAREDIYCERFLLDYPRSLETGSRLGDFDVIAFSWQFELDALNILKILHRNNIPLRRDERRQLVVIGGPCTVNPYPLRQVADLFYIGEAEVGLLSLLDEWRKGGLESLPGIRGVYISELDNEVERVYFNDLDSYHPVAQIMSPGAAFGESFLLEASRGCGFGCRFCMGGYTYRPRRERSLHKLKEIVEEGIRVNSPRKIAVLGASLSDYSRAEELLEFLAEKNLEISVPSLRAGSLTKPMVEALVRSGQRSLTLAPESSQRLRWAANKRITDAEIREAVNLAFEAGIRNIKLYFMLGLPGETDEDVEEIIALVRGFKGRVRLSVNPFIPKPHTPYQWAGFEDLGVLKRRMRLLKKELRCVFEDLRASFIQAAIARGDEALGEVLIDAAIRGGSLGSIRKASKEKGVELRRYVEERKLWEEFPWDKIDVGIRKKALSREYSRAMELAPCCGS
jgi:radical SAM superfamily enzyme YgiQ (UPF0313 family)